jgi:hypothetical protein
MSASDPPGSDISEFAKWEAEHPSQVNGESERERSLADMVRSERMQIWGDRDSSNDARSSDEEAVVEEKGRNGVVRKMEVVEILSLDSESEDESVGQEGFWLYGYWLIKRQDGEDDAPPSSQPRPESVPEDEDEDEDEDEEGHATEIISEEQGAAENMIEISSKYEEYNNEETEEEDEFAGFDVTPEEKEFLNELLDVAPPEEVKKLTGKNRRSSDPFSDIMPDKQTTKNVGSFAKDHPFRKQQAWTKAELQEYMDDVYEFATAAGMSEFHAGLEVQKATGAWKLQKGLPLDNEDELEAERKERVKNLESSVHFGHHKLHLAKDKLREEGHSKHKKRKRDPEGSQSSNPARGAPQSERSEDVRSIETKSEDCDSFREAKRRKKAEKKARRRARRQAKESALSVSSEEKPSGSKTHYAEEVESAVSQTTGLSTTPESKKQSPQNRLTGEDPLPIKQKGTQAEKPKLQSSQSYYAEEERTSPLTTAARDDISVSTADEKSVGLALKKKRREKVEKKKLKKKAKLGPKTSEHFAKSKPSGLPFSTILKDNITPPLRTKNAEAPRSQSNYGEKMEQLQMTKARRGGHPDRIKKMAEEARQAVKNAPVLVKDASMKKGLKVSSKTNTEPEVVEKKKKNRNHKRHRNKNRLAEQPSGENEESSNVVNPDEDEAVDFPPKKKKHHGRSQKYDGDGDPGKEQDLDLTAPTRPITERENSGDPSHGQFVSVSAEVVREGGDRPSKRRDRGRKPKSKKEDLDMPDVSDSVVVEPVITVSDVVLESIEPDELSSKKKRKRSKSKSKERKIELGDIDELADVEPLTELADTNSKNSKKGRRGHGQKRALSVDAMDLDIRQSNQSSKVHHSQ